MIYPFHYFLTGSLAILLGVLLGSYFSISLLPGVLVALFCLLAIIFARLPWARLLLVLVACLTIGMVRFEMSAIQSIPNNYLNRSLAISGQVISHPEIQNDGQSFYLQTEFIDGVKQKHKILLQTPLFPTVHYGSTLQTVGVLKMDGESGYMRYLRKDNIVAIGKSYGDMVVEDPISPSVISVLYKTRDYIASRINQLFPEPTSGLMNGLLLGLRAQLSDELKANLKNSGTTHIIALSGFNITIIAGFLIFLCRPLPRKWGLLVAGLGIIAFVLMTGASSSVTRAAIMGLILLFTLWWGRRRYSFSAVWLAGAIMVLINPYILQYDVGFQLSFAATIGIIALTPILSSLLKWLPKLFSEIVATTISATVFTLPLVAFHFGGFSAISLISNLIVLPIVPIAMLLGFVSLVIAIILPWDWLNILGTISGKIILLLINFFGSLDFSFIETPNVSVWGPLVYYLLLIVIYFWWNEKSHHKI